MAISARWDVVYLRYPMSVFVQKFLNRSVGLMVELTAMPASLDATESL